MKISDSRCVVTGATEGIGYAVASALLARGARVAICARNAEAVDRVVESWRAEGHDAWGMRCDVSDEASVEAFASAAIERLSGVDVLINNAGIGEVAPFLDLTMEQIDRVFAVNVRGTFLATRAFLPGMVAQEDGHIVNVVSLAGKNSFVGGTAYSASKHAVIGFSRSLMLEVRNSNVRVTAVCPGSVVTPFFEKAGLDTPDADRVLHAEDVAQTIVAALDMDPRALVSEIDLRPANP